MKAIVKTKSNYNNCNGKCLTVIRADEILSKLSQHDVIKSVCAHDFGCFNQFTRCRKCGIV
jgi:Asp-tRNA(Asn)/Glu-tRNA(Gln) amidotransferase C subunit